MKMAATVLAGVVDTEDVLADERKPDMDEMIRMLDPDTTQFTTMMQQIGKETAIREKILWMEEEFMPRLSALAASAASALTTLAVTAGQGTYFRVNDVVRIASTGEAFGVVSISTDNLGVRRAIGGVVAATAQTGAELLIVSNASKQGSSGPQKAMTKKNLGYNYCQTHRHNFEVTGTNKRIARYGEQEPTRERYKKFIEHKRALEYTNFYGARDFIAAGISGSDANPTGFTGGLVEFISTWKTNINGALSATGLDAFMIGPLSKGSKNKVFFCSPVIASAISNLLRTAWHPATTSDRLWGAKVDAFLDSAYGYRIPVVVKKDWIDFSTSGGQYGSRGFLVDMEYVSYKTLQNGGKTRLWRDQQENDEDTAEEGYFTEATLEVAQEKVHGMMYGVTS